MSSDQLWKTNLNIGVFFGSRSPEHDVSIITAQLIISGLRKIGYKVTPVYINKKGDWFVDERLGKIEFFQQPDYEEIIEAFPRFSADLESSKGKMVLRRRGIWPRTIVIDVAFPAFHGSYGEDGTIQGLFEMLNVPYVGCDVASSAMAMDKILTKLLYQAIGIPTTEFIYFNKRNWESGRDFIFKDLKTKLKWPVFVKPAGLGSSIGIAKVKEEKELEQAIEVALHYDEKVLVEEAVENLMDVTCAVLGNDDPQLSLLQESSFQDQFFSYEEKYLKKGGAQLGRAKDNIFIPARLDDRVAKNIQDTAVKIFKLFGCSGIARVDFLYDTESGKFYANEINTMPGTLYYHLWKESGVSLDQLLLRLVDLALEKHIYKKSVVLAFNSDILKGVSGSKFKLE